MNTRVVVYPAELRESLDKLRERGGVVEYLGRTWRIERFSLPPELLAVLAAVDLAGAPTTEK